MTLLDCPTPKVGGGCNSDKLLFCVNVEDLE